MKITFPNFSVSCDFFPPSDLSELSFVRQNVPKRQSDEEEQSLFCMKILILEWNFEVVIRNIVENCYLFYIYSLIIFWFCIQHYQWLLMIEFERYLLSVWQGPIRFQNVAWKFAIWDVTVVAKVKTKESKADRWNFTTNQNIIERLQCSFPRELYIC